MSHSWMLQNWLLMYWMHEYFVQTSMDIWWLVTYPSRITKSLTGWTRSYAEYSRLKKKQTVLEKIVSHAPVPVLRKHSNSHTLLESMCISKRFLENTQVTYRNSPSGNSFSQNNNQEHKETCVNMFTMSPCLE